MTCVPRAPSDWPQLAQNCPGPVSAPQRGQWGTSGIGVARPAVEPPGWKVVAGVVDRAPGEEAAGTKRVAGPPPLGKERMTADPEAGCGAGAMAGGFGSGAGGGGTAADPIGAPHDAQSFAPGSL
jgi:hypothetical protein